MELKDYLELPYTITLRVDDEGAWVARIKELPGCTADGATQAQALTEVAQAQREWLQAALEDGVPIPLPEPEEQLPSGKWLQRSPRSLHASLVRLAKLEGVSFNHYVTSALSEHVGRKALTATTTVKAIAVQLTGTSGQPLGWAMSATKTVSNSATGGGGWVNSDAGVLALNNALTERD